MSSDQFTMAIPCHWCGHTGMSLWEDIDGNRQRVSLGGYSERIARKESFQSETVCNDCGKTQPV